MHTHARVVVIGGGIVGCSVLYHLTRMGWSDVVLLERAELTAGSTWHAAGNCPNFSTSWNIMKLQSYSNRLYRRLPAEVDYAIDHRASGSIRLAHNSERMAEFRARRRHGAGSGPRLRDPLGERDQGASPVRRDPRRPGRALGSRRWRHRSEPGHPGAGQGRARRGRGDLPAQFRCSRSPAAPPASGGSRRRRAQSPARSWSTPPATAHARSAGWSASTCRSSRCSTSIW